MRTRQAFHRQISAFVGVIAYRVAVEQRHSRALQSALHRRLVITQIAGAQRRHHTMRLQVIAGRRDEPRPSQRQLAIVGEAQHGLHRALAVRRAADHDGASGILQSGGDDLGG